ncbi:hypothetical protein ACGFNP_41715 [Nonomuraea sp. NPDC049269]|uniref:hypothetical protein n=1 Tax=Nonomuraea sp. NPDC049269 TaxID=3364349 RepID=UPI0037106B50
MRKAKRAGADFIKVYSRLDRESFLAIADEARRLRLPVCGHAADAVPIVEAARAGQRSFEHFFPALFGVSGKESEVRRLIDAIKIQGKGTGVHDWFAAIHPADWLACTTYDPHRAADVYAQLKESGAAMTPTLVMHRVTDLPDHVVADKERLRYLPPGTEESWKAALAEIFTKGRT